LFAKKVKSIDEAMLKYITHDGEIAMTVELKYGYAYGKGMQSEMDKLQKAIWELQKAKKAWIEKLNSTPIRQGRELIDQMEDKQSRDFVIKRVNELYLSIQSQTKEFTDRIHEAEELVYNSRQELKRGGIKVDKEKLTRKLKRKGHAIKQMISEEKRDPETGASSHGSKYNMLEKVFGFASRDVEVRDLTGFMKSEVSRIDGSEDSRTINDMPEIIKMSNRMVGNKLQFKDPKLSAQLSALHTKLRDGVYHISRMKLGAMNTVCHVLCNSNDPNQVDFGNFLLNLVSSALVVDDDHEWDDVWTTISDNLLSRVNFNKITEKYVPFHREQKLSLKGVLSPAENI
jgi:hypothetical protein